MKFVTTLPGGWFCGNVRTATPKKKLLKKHIRGFSPGFRYFPEISNAGDYAIMGVAAIWILTLSVELFRQKQRRDGADIPRA